MRKLMTVLATGAAVSAMVSASAQGASVRFQSPSGNVACAGETEPPNNQVRCDIRLRNWSAPPKPAWCLFDWGNGMWIGRRGPARWNCVSDTVLGAGTVLRYGTAIQIGGVRCSSTRRYGITCRNLDRRGLRINRRFIVRF